MTAARETLAIMMKRAGLALLLLAVFYSTASHSAKVDSQLQSSIERRFPGCDIFDMSQGTLAGDGLRYTVVIVACPIENDDEHKMRIAVVRQEDERLLPVATSKEWRHYLASRISWSVEIKEGTLLVSRGGSTGSSSGMETKARFRLMRGHIYLIGEERTSYGMEPVGRDFREQFFEAKTSINYLAGKAIDSKRIGPPKSDPNLLGFGGKTRYREIQADFKSRSLAAIADYDGFEGPYSPPGGCKYLDEFLRYVSCRPFQE